MSHLYAQHLHTKTRRGDRIPPTTLQGVNIKRVGVARHTLEVIIWSMSLLSGSNSSTLAASNFAHPTADLEWTELNGLICGVLQFNGLRCKICLDNEDGTHYVVEEAPKSLVDEYNNIIFSENETKASIDRKIISFVQNWSAFARLSSNPTVRGWCDHGMALIGGTTELVRTTARLACGMSLPSVINLVRRLAYISPTNDMEYTDIMNRLADVLCIQDTVDAQQWTSARFRCQEFAKHSNRDKMILPMFSQRHAAYAVIEKVSLDVDEYYVAICNGGVGWDNFSTFLGPCPAGQKRLSQCILVCARKYVNMIVNTVATHWLKEAIFEEVGKIIKVLSTRYSKEDGFEVLDPALLANGTSPWFPGQHIGLLEQRQGNCAVHNLMEAIKFYKKSFENLTEFNVSEVQRMLQLYTTFREELSWSSSLRQVKEKYGMQTYQTTMSLCDTAIRSYEERLRLREGASYEPLAVLVDFLET